ncbi:hypothetical protein ACFQO7_32035 [Catellatospora aurea]|uniref:Caspase domain-containing protein n=1 Tax=Catellatospora aurea TaxID=1337874 RepID=A0ABW2H964_9ACTN
MVEQVPLLGTMATAAAMRHEIVRTRHLLRQGGLLFLSYFGHSIRTGPASTDVSWCLQDAQVPVAGLGRLLSRLGAGTRVVVVVDSCYASALGGCLPARGDWVLVASCAAYQTTMNLPSSEFLTKLESVTFPEGRRDRRCASYERLEQRLQEGTAAAERPRIMAGTPAGLRRLPLSVTAVSR